MPFYLAFDMRSANMANSLVLFKTDQTAIFT